MKPQGVRIELILAELLRGDRTDYVLSSEALTYMAEHNLPQSVWLQLSLSMNRVFQDQQQWHSLPQTVGYRKEQNSHVKTATEGALLGAVITSRQ
ncbi:MAG: hypothetical protein QNJ65_07365 [Xenococcaceae cyanobacterium MO_234.B1]|nr:hypothetical protein [Xenococcaceae cyanobacterium MO_234.B1]